MNPPPRQRTTVPNSPRRPPVEAGWRSDALRLGSLECVDAPDGVVAYERRSGADRRRVVLNFETSPAKLDPGRGWVVDVATDGEGEGDAFSGLLAGDTGVVLRPA